MKGLEVSEVRFSELNNEHRIDAEYFSKENLAGIKRLSDFGTFQIGDIAEVTDGIHTSIDYDENSRVNLISATSPKENVFDLSRGAFISEKAHAENPRTALRKNDVIISTVGTIGNCAVVDDSILPANSDRHVGIIRIKDDYSPYILSTFLLSKYGRMQTLRESTGNVQLNLFIYKLRELQIPDFSTDFQSQIESLVKSAHEKLSESKSLYAQAEDTLLSELGLKNWQPKNENINVKTLSESFLSSGRLDAEYYQSKYDEIEQKIKCNAQYVSLFELFDLLSNPSPKQYYSEGIKVIKTKNIRIPAIEYDTISDCTIDDCLKIQNGDLLFASMGVGSLGRMSFVFDTKFDCTIDGTIKLLRIKNKFKNQYYEIPTLLFLTSTIGQELIYKNVIGSTGIISISKESIENLIVPIVNREKRIEITNKVYQSFALKAESKRLLEEAKMMVEKEIEKGSK
ncbi:MAG: restriction endonuclease subunit S [Bacteroidales bacterium]|nr:restriction endonuclease subunit S [Bacteroidales bacterium]